MSQQSENDNDHKVNLPRLYATVARTMPSEGKDYTVEILKPDGAAEVAAIVPITDIGRAWVPHLRAALEGAGIRTLQQEQARREPEAAKTLRKLREEAERATNAALSSRASRLSGAADEAQERARAAAKAGTGDEAVSLRRAAVAAMRDAATAKRALAAEGRVRDAVNVAAGQSWSALVADEDTLVPANDEATGIRAMLAEKEAIVSRAAAAYAAYENLVMAAADAVKRYSARKETK